MFHPFLNRKSKIYAYSSEICRSISLEYVEDVEHLGIQGYRFKSVEDTYEDPRINAKNECFCLEDHVEKCPYAGLLSLESCMKGKKYYTRFM